MNLQQSNSYNSLDIQKIQGTLAIDLGNSTTVVAFQGEIDNKIRLLDLSPISRIPGEVPSLVWQSSQNPPYQAVGNEVSNLGFTKNNQDFLISDFKRWICAPKDSFQQSFNISPEKAGEILIQQIWDRIPSEFEVKRLVLTAPVETYREYRTWLMNVCNELNVKEIALVDEPTAAAMGAGLSPGSKLLVVDIGGSTIDMSLVVLEGGEGKAEPVAQLLRFAGENLQEKSNQILRCAKVLGKAGQRIGGRDIDRWIVDYLYRDISISETILNAAERLKCRLSEADLKETKVLSEKINNASINEVEELQLSKLRFEQLLKDKGLIKILKTLFEHTLLSGKRNGCDLEDIDHVVLVGGGSRIPLIQRWLEEECKPIKLLKPPSIEAVAMGALNLTPGVSIRDVLQRGVSLRCWDQKNQVHLWHPLFIAGQPWPTTKPLEIILSASKIDQKEIELIVGEPDFESANEIIYVNGIPTIKSKPMKPKTTPIIASTTSIFLNKKSQPGEDCLKLEFSLNKDCQLIVQGTDLRSNEAIYPKAICSVR